MGLINNKVNVFRNNAAPFTNADDLLIFLGLDPRDSRNSTSATSKNSRILVPKSFANRMRPFDLSDPLLRQVLPIAEELENKEGNEDPVGDEKARTDDCKVLLKKYNTRALLLTTEKCAIRCRFCFRRNMPSDCFADDYEQLFKAIYLLQHRTDINELILSGGDPLTLPYKILKKFLTNLNAVKHIERIRIHTRLPVADPIRVNKEMLEVLSSAKKPLIIVLHTNHANELNQETNEAAARLHTISSCLLNQTVLLKGVNDSAEILAELSKKLIQQRIVPYYLHQLDRAKGVCHFEVPIPKGKAIVKELAENHSGYLVPKYVQETAGSKSKNLL